MGFTLAVSIVTVPEGTLRANLRSFDALLLLNIVVVTINIASFDFDASAKSMVPVGSIIAVGGHASASTEVLVPEGGHLTSCPSGCSESTVCQAVHAGAVQRAAKALASLFVECLSGGTLGGKALARADFLVEVLVVRA